MTLENQNVFVSRDIAGRVRRVEVDLTTEASGTTSRCCSSWTTAHDGRRPGTSAPPVLRGNSRLRVDAVVVFQVREEGGRSAHRQLDGT